MEDNFSVLPDEIIYDTTLHYLTLPDISRLCRVNDRFNRIICKNERFWHQRFIIDFNYDPVDYKGSWKTLYMNYPSVWSFGYNKYGQLGTQGLDKYTPGQISDFKALDISVGVYHSVLIDLNNNVWGFGNNEYGQLKVEHNLRSQEKNILTPKLLPNLKAKKVSAGAYYTILIDLDGNVLTFGDNTEGQLGLGNLNSGYIYSPKVIPKLKAKDISAGNNHTIVIDEENNVYVFGGNNDGQLGLGDYDNRYFPVLLPNIKGNYISAGNDTTLIIDDKNNAWVCGSNSYGQLGLGFKYGFNDDLYVNTLTQIKNLKAKQGSFGDLHLVIIDIDNVVWGMGYGEISQLGYDASLLYDDRLSPTKITDIKAKLAFAGGNSTFIIDLNNDVWVVGENDDGVLGLGRDHAVGQLEFKQHLIVDKLTKLENFKASKIATGYHTLMIAAYISSE